MATVAIVILGILWIPIMRSVGDVLYTYLQDVQSVLAPGIAAAFLLGICWKRTSAQGGMWGLIAGMIIGLTRLGAKVYYSNVGDVSSSTFKYLFYDMNWLFFCGWMFLFCIVVVIAVSMFTAAPSAEKIQGLVFGTSTPEQKQLHVRVGINGISFIPLSSWVLLLLLLVFLVNRYVAMIYIHAAYSLNKIKI